MTQVGFIGLGIMGRPMAGHLQKAGHKLALTLISSIVSLGNFAKH